MTKKMTITLEENLREELSLLAGETGKKKKSSGSPILILMQSQQL